MKPSVFALLLMVWSGSSCWGQSGVITGGRNGATNAQTLAWSVELYRILLEDQAEAKAHPTKTTCNREEQQ